MGSKPISITLPSDMLEEVDRAKKREQRTRSELVREALRHYLYVRRVPMVDPTPEELRAIEAGEAEIARGEYVTLDELKHDLATQDRKKGRKKSQKASATR